MNMEGGILPAHLLAAASPSFTQHARALDEIVLGTETTEVNQLATHLPDVILNMNLHVKPPFVRQHSGVIMFLDISGFTDLSEKCSVNMGSGSDQLTAILNDYMGSMIDQVLKIEGDVLKFAGDAILVFWRIKDYDHLLKLAKQVIRCSVEIQEKCGSYNADGLTTLRVKIALSLGRMYFHVFGQNSHYYFCESGNAVRDARTAEGMSKSGDVIVSPYLWSFCEEKEYLFTMLPDDRHVKVTSVLSSLERQNQLFGVIPTTVMGQGPSGDGVQKSTESCAPHGDIDAVIRKRVFYVPDGLNEVLRKYVTETVLDKLEAGHGVEYHSEIRPCTIAFVNLQLTRENMKAYMQCEVLQKSYELIHSELEYYKASLNKAIMFDKGCSFLIIFGLPGRKDSYDCKHAVQCAWKIRQKLQDMEDVAVASIGVTTGHTFCGVVGHEHRHEYTVIGRTVNMAARLMIYYPGIVSCDNETYTHSRLRQHHFRDVPVKELKGLKAVATIREYTEDSSNICYISPPLSVYRYPMVGNAREMEVYEKIISGLAPGIGRASVPGESFRNVLLFEGTQDTGVTRLLASIAEQTKKQGCPLVEASLTSNDVNRPHFVIRTIIGELLNLNYESNKESNRYEAFKEILHQSKEFTDKEVHSILTVVETVLILSEDTVPEQIPDGLDKELGEALCTILFQILNIAIKKLDKMLVIVIDDAEYMDIFSWKFIVSLAGRPGIVIVMGMLTLEKASPVSEMENLLAQNLVTRVKVEPLANNLLAPVACQMMDVSAIPIELEQLLCERSQGMPGYIKHILSDLLTSQRLKIVSLLHYHSSFDDFVWPNYELITGHQSSVARKKSMLKTKNKWAYQTQIGDKEESAEDRICIVPPDRMIIPALYKTPDSLKGELLTEFDQISPTEQMAMKCASVVGSVCCTAILKMLWPLPAATFNSAMDKLFRKDYLRCFTATKLRSRNQSYNCCMCDKDESGLSACKIITFSNLMMRDTVYSMLLEDQRTDMHYKIARHLEATAPTMNEEHGQALMDQESSSLADSTENIFQDCILKRPNIEYDIISPQQSESLYGVIRRNNCLYSYVAHELGSFCSQKSLDFLGDHHPVESPVKNETRKRTVGFTPSTDELLHKAIGLVEKKQRPASTSNKIKLKDKLAHRHRKPRNTVAGLASFTPIGSFSGMGGGKDSFYGGGAPGRRRGGSHGASLGGDSGSGSIFSLAFGGTGSTGQLQTKEAIAKYAERLRPSIGRSGLNTQMKLSLFRQTIWHWKSALHLRNTLLSLVEAGCVSMESQMYREALSFLGYAKLFLSSVKDLKNPLNGEQLTEITEQKLKDFWQNQAGKVSCLLGQVYFIVGKMELAAKYYSEGLAELDFAIPQAKVQSFLFILKQKIPSHPPCFSKKHGSPTTMGRDMEVARILSSVFLLGGTNGESKMVSLLLSTNIHYAELAEDQFEILIAKTHLVKNLQAKGKYSAANSLIKHVRARSWTSPNDEEMNMALIYFHHACLTCYLCQGQLALASDEVSRINDLQQILQRSEYSAITAQDIHFFLLSCNGSVESRSSLLEPLLVANEGTYWSCMWEELLYNSMEPNEIVSLDGSMIAYTDILLTRRLGNVTDDYSSSDPHDYIENSILTSYVLYLVHTGRFPDLDMMEAALFLLEGSQPDTLNSYIAAWSYCKVIAAMLLTLHSSRHPNTMVDLLNKMLTKSREFTKSIPAILPWHKRLLNGLQSWRRMAEVPSNLLPYQNN